MGLKALLTHLLKEDTPDEENGANVPPESEVTPSHASGDTVDQEKEGIYSSDPEQNGGTTRKDEQDLDPDNDQESNDALRTVVVSDQPDAPPRGLRRVFFRIFSSVFPPPSEEEEIQAYIPHYRVLPILSGAIIPFCILLDIPGITADWYICLSGSTIIASKPNPPLLDAAIALSIVCAVLANVCLVIRFLERRIKAMTILCTVFLSIHDAINIAALAAFGATKDGYSFSQAFWLTLCSTIVSMFTNVTLIIDLIRTPDFKRSGSGLTRRQRSLVIITIGLFCYIALGGLVNSLLLNLSFINGLYFTVVTIETIGFGDIVPKGTSSRVFICFYATLGIINLAFMVGYVRETVLEGLDFGYRRRLLAIQQRRRALRRRRRVEKRWRHAIIWRLRERHAPVWISKNVDDVKSVWSLLSSYFWHAEWKILSTTRRSKHHSRPRHGMQLNLWALPPCQLEAAALEAGCSLDTFLPADFYDTYDQHPCGHPTGVEHGAHILPSWFAVHPVYHHENQATDSLTHRRLGAMAAILTKLSFAVYESGGNRLPSGSGFQDTAGEDDSFRSLQTSSTVDYRDDVANTEQKAYYTRSGLSWGWFLIFWMGGAAIFKATEGWSYGSAIYFCFIAFTTIGYGDLVPTTPAGRSIFVVWALVGVATMTIFISVVSEAYSSRYKGILGRNSFKRVVKQYHHQNKTELSDQVQRIGTSTGISMSRHDTYESGEGEVVETDAFPTITDPAVASTSMSQLRAPYAPQSLDRLPRQILVETRSIQQYMQLIGDFDERSASTVKFVDQAVWGLIDEIMQGRELTECTKKDILKDTEARQTLMLLGIERSLKELVNISEQAMTAIRQRDQVIATLERGAEQDEGTTTESAGVH